jgi:outer membrane usher protein
LPPVATSGLAPAALLCCLVATPLLAAPPIDVARLRDLETRLNRTRNALTMTATVRDGAEALGEVMLTIAPDDSIEVDRDGLIHVLRPQLSASAIAVIAGLPPQVPVDKLASLPGAAITFDRSSLDLAYAARAEGGSDRDVSLRPRGPKVPVTPPATVSGYLNITTLLNHAWNTSNQDARTGLSFNFDGAARYMGLVLEGEASSDGPLDSFLCPVEARCSYAHVGGLKRQGTRLVGDLPDQHTRVTVGDLSYWGHPLQRGNELLGIGIVHDARLFGSNHRLDSAAASTLALDRPADVQVVVNGVPLQRLRLKAGTYRLTDLPLTAGSNDVELIVTSDAGERRSIRVKALNHGQLLAPGKTEWAANGGVASYVVDHERDYAESLPVGNAVFRMGLTNHLTGDVHAQADHEIVMGGVGVLGLTPFGLWGLSLAASLTGGVGYAATLSWEYLPPAQVSEHRQTVRAQADYQTLGFLRPGDLLIGRSGVLYPTFQPWLRLNGSWTIELSPLLLATASARYAFADSSSLIPGAVSTDIDRWGMTLALTSPLSPTLTGTIYAGYGNERLLSFGGVEDGNPDFQIGVRVSWMPGRGTHVQADTDSLTGQTVISGSTRSGTDNNLWTASVAANQADVRGGGLLGAVAHHGRYADVLASHTATSRPGSVLEPDIHYTALRSTTAIAFADGQVGVGPAIRDAFVLVHPHASIANSQVIVGDTDEPRATGSRYMPALLTALPPYTDTRLPLHASDLPLGYSLGSASLAVRPPYKAGYAVEVGSDSALSVYGTLLGPDHQPLALASGYATPAGQSTPKLAVFTNSAGRFALEGVTEGAWTITMPTGDAQLTYLVAVATGDSALVNAGTLSPPSAPEAPHAPSWHPDVVADAGAPARR